MKFGVVYNTGHYGVDPDALIAVARHAEDCGFESFYLPEHVALFPGGSGRSSSRPVCRSPTRSNACPSWPL